jgi:hypothetical protein
LVLLSGAELCFDRAAFVHGALDGLAAVDDEGVAEGEGGVVGAEPEHGCCDFVDGAESADRYLACSCAMNASRLSSLSSTSRPIIWVSMTPADGVDADVGGGVVACSALGESDETELGGAVPPSPGEGPLRVLPLTRTRG